MIFYIYDGIGCVAVRSSFYTNIRMSSLLVSGRSDVSNNRQLVALYRVSKCLKTGSYDSNVQVLSN